MSSSIVPPVLITPTHSSCHPWSTVSFPSCEPARKTAPRNGAFNGSFSKPRRACSASCSMGQRRNGLLVAPGTTVGIATTRRRTTRPRKHHAASRRCSYGGERGGGKGEKGTPPIPPLFVGGCGGGGGGGGGVRCSDRGGSDPASVGHRCRL